MRKSMNRRDFLKKTGVTTSVIGFAGMNSLTIGNSNPAQQILPRWKGFNLLDYFSAYPSRHQRGVKDDHFKWMRDWGFDFVRLPMAYPRYLDIDYSKKITPEDVYKFNEKEIDHIEEMVFRANYHGLHMSLNLHRAPGYCVNAGFHEPYNLWLDEQAQEAFYAHWGMWAKRFKNLSSDKISFDLVNEPSMREDMNDQHSKRSAVPGEIYRKVSQEASKAIRKYNPDHLIIADGNNVGSDVIPEITDLNIAQSCRGYYPHYISHYRAPWVFKNPDDAPETSWPGAMGGKYYSREDLEEFYASWIELAKQGVGVHCGECGCWNETPHDVFLSWFGDVLDILTKDNIGYALWNFIGDFGLIDSGRNDVDYKDWHGHKLDAKMLALLQKY